ncbi:MAG: M23 family metallopeptidase [Flavobacteriales bacterium]|nr:M23 family metallopeptidase [Flavobacteriales bacterium]
MKQLFLLSFSLISLSIFSQTNYHSPLNFELLLSGTFGELRGSHFHTGIDIKTEGVEGQKVFSIADGYVSRIKVSTWGYGKAIYITHPDGNTSVYAHLKEFNKEIEKYVNEQQYKKENFEIQLFPSKEKFPIKRGEVIALSGNTGGSGGAHLHFEIRNTKSEHPINPLQFNFDVTDNIQPTIVGIKIYPHQNSSVNNKNESVKYSLTKKGNNYSVNSKQSIKVNGDISFSISTYDKLNGAYNKNGVYSIKLFIDNNLIHHFLADELSFSEKRFLNAHIDYSEYTESKTKYNRCFNLPYNKLSNYKTNVNDGIFNFIDSLTHKIRFEVEDFEGNKSEVNFEVQSQSTSPEFETEDSGDRFLYNQANVYKNLKFEAHLEKYSLYEDCNVHYSVGIKTDNTLSEIHNFMSSSIPIHKNYVLSIKEKIAKNITDKVYIAKVNDNGTFTYKGNSWRGSFLSAKVREFGNFTIISDTVNPIILGINVKDGKNISSQTTIKCTIEDKGSGISFYRGEINGKWILMEYDYKKNLLTYKIPSDFEKGKHTLTVVVKDRMGNKTEYTDNFTY